MKLTNKDIIQLIKLLKYARDNTFHPDAKKGLLNYNNYNNYGHYWGDTTCSTTPMAARTSKQVLDAAEAAMDIAKSEAKGIADFENFKNETQKFIQLLEEDVNNE